MRFGLGGELAQAGVEVVRDDRRGAAGRADQHRQHVPFDVVEDVAGLANERILVARHARERTELEQERARLPRGRCAPRARSART